MKTSPDNPLLQYVIDAKAAYRKVSRAQTWEEKIASVVRMRESSRLAKEGMQETMKSGVFLKRNG